jgi:peptidoglycan lytic transglycosylase
LRPHISGRAIGARRALIALTLACALIGAPVALAAGIAPPSGPAQTATAPLAGISPSTVPGSTGPLAVFARVHTKLAIGHVALNVLDGQVAIVKGALRPALAGRPVVLQRLGRKGWRTIARTHTGARGRFALRYVPHRLLSERIRVLFAGDARDLPVHRSVGSLSSYRLAVASWYGGGGGLACGGSLTSSTMGVANKTLPCGTRVTLRYGGRTVNVPVVDRGPFVAGREFDLTEATKNALGFEGVGTVWSTR